MHYVEFDQFVGTVYGMNSGHRPERHWAAGHPFAPALMVLGSIVVYPALERLGLL
ncbi:hypothetical protein [Actinoallomurus acaciae]|uniref:Uncharacterized protein n=1 Tax=Actinoallomurus acaciae TaxID=502577 RepID=A0ABV5YIL6_9ACTN